jgi:thioesterase domain-containing protein
LLGGYSGGGVVAFEMAQRLGAEGEPVSLLALIDTYQPQLKPRAITFGTRWARLRREGLHYVAGAVRTRRELHRQAGAYAAVDRHLDRAEPIPLPLRDLHLTRSFREAACSYRPRPWRGRATLFRASGGEEFFEDLTPGNGWEPYLEGGVEIVPIPGAHLTLLLGANGQALGPLLLASIQQAQQQGPQG